MQEANLDNWLEFALELEPDEYCNLEYKLKGQNENYILNMLISGRQNLV